MVNKEEKKAFDQIHPTR